MVKEMELIFDLKNCEVSFVACSQPYVVLRFNEKSISSREVPELVQFAALVIDPAIWPQFARPLLHEGLAQPLPIGR